jgi:Cellulose biosynthesis protein BcsS
MSDAHNMITIRRFLVAASLLVWSGGSHADGNILLTGAELREQGTHYAYVGSLSPLPGDNRLGDGWIQRYWLDTYTYDYEAGPSTIEVRAYGVEAALGYQGATGQVNWGASIGLRFQHTSLDPEDPGNDTRGNHAWPKLQIEGGAPMGARWRANLIAAYVAKIDGYWTRGRFMRELAGSHQAGLELIAQGDPNYSAQKLGLVYGGIKLGENWGAAARAGYHFQSGANSAYVSLEFSRNY